MRKMELFTSGSESTVTVQRSGVLHVVGVWIIYNYIFTFALHSHYINNGNFLIPKWS